MFRAFAFLFLNLLAGGIAFSAVKVSDTGVLESGSSHELLDVFVHLRVRVVEACCVVTLGPLRLQV